MRSQDSWWSMGSQEITSCPAATRASFALCNASRMGGCGVTTPSSHNMAIDSLLGMPTPSAKSSFHGSSIFALQLRVDMGLITDLSLRCRDHSNVTPCAQWGQNLTTLSAWWTVWGQVDVAEMQAVQPLRGLGRPRKNIRLVRFIIVTWAGLDLGVSLKGSGIIGEVSSTQANSQCSVMSLGLSTAPLPLIHPNKME